MFNSGLIGMEPAHLSLLDDTLAMIDALIGRAKKFPAIEQFALSEVLRLSQVGIAEIHGTFLHYWQGRRRIYMANRIARTLSPDWDDLTPPKQWADMNYWAVRTYNYYYGVTHALDMFK
jgi:negative regulator of replication initiation